MNELKPPGILEEMDDEELLTMGVERESALKDKHLRRVNRRRQKRGKSVE